MTEEFFRSFRKNLFKNVLLMLMFSVSLLMTILMGSYYLNLDEENDAFLEYRKNGTWRDTIIPLSVDTTEMRDSTDTLQGCQRLMEYYARLHDSEEHPILTVNTQQGCDVREKDFLDLLGDTSYKGFVSEEYPEAYTAYFGSEDEGEGCSMFTLKCVSLDDTAFKVYGLRTGEGEGFSADNLTLQDASDPVPVLLGNEYKGVISVGQTIEISFVSDVFLCRVAGILEKGSTIPADGCAVSEAVLLDPYVIFPYNVRVSGEPASQADIARYANLVMVALNWGGTRVFIGDDSEVRDAMAMFRDIAKEYDFPPLQVGGASMGLQLLHNESAARVRVILILTLALIGFTFYGMFAVFYDKIQSNKRIYAIYQMNGCSLGLILIPFLAEIAVILAPAVFACRVICSETWEIGFSYMAVGVDTGMILRVAGGFIGLAFFAGAVFVVCLLKGVDTEQLIRQKD